MRKVASARKSLEKILSTGKPVYGVNTGFGELASVRISKDRLAQVQRNLVLSHACGVGEPMSPAEAPSRSRKTGRNVPEALTTPMNTESAWTRRQFRARTDWADGGEPLGGATMAVNATTALHRCAPRPAHPR